MEALHIGYFEAAVAGLLSFASPCVLPLVVPYLAWVGGIAMPGASDADTPGRLPRGALGNGVAFAFGWSPCVGPVLATILTLAGTRESLAEGAGLLAVYGAAMGAPFLLGAVFTAPFLRLVRRVQPHRRFLELATGGLVVATGL